MGCGCGCIRGRSQVIRGASAHISEFADLSAKVLFPKTLSALLKKQQISPLYQRFLQDAHVSTLPRILGSR